MTPVEETGRAGRKSISSARLVALAELAAFLAIALISKRVLDPMIWRFSGPVSLAGTLLLLTVYMRFRGRGWASMGLPAFPGQGERMRLLLRVLLTFAGFCAGIAILLFGSEALGLEFMSEDPPGVEERWGSVQGNVFQYLLWLGIVWTVAAFGEEMFFRGFLITQMQRIFGEVRWGAVLSVILAALIFGYGHYYYQGLRGLLTTGTVALVFGTCFLLFKRNLWPIVIVHGLIDTLTFTALYMGWE